MLVRALQDPLYRLALRFLSLAEPARDATQEIMILVVTQLSTFRGESAVTTWAYRIAARHLLRQRLSRARRKLDEFMGKHCGVASSAARCRCLHQISFAEAQGRLNRGQPRFPPPSGPTSLDTLRAFGGIKATRRALELYRAQPVFPAPEDLATEVRRMLEQAPTLTHC